VVSTGKLRWRIVALLALQIYDHPALPYVKFIDVPGGDDNFNPPEVQ
jgi:hypothetical protein